MRVDAAVATGVSKKPIHAVSRFFQPHRRNWRSFCRCFFPDRSYVERVLDPTLHAETQLVHDVAYELRQHAEVVCCLEGGGEEGSVLCNQSVRIDM